MTTSAPKPQEKQQLLEDLLREDFAFIHIATSTKGAVLPLTILQSPIATLKVSHNFAGPMTVSEDGVVAELRFGERPFTCKIPWSAIWGMTSFDNKKLLWPEEIPSDVLEKAAQEAATKDETPSAQPAPKTKPAPKNRPTLKRVK
jgi:hypothetical protein